MSAAFQRRFAGLIFVDFIKYRPTPIIKLRALIDPPPQGEGGVTIALEPINLVTCLGAIIAAFEARPMVTVWQVWDKLKLIRQIMTLINKVRNFQEVCNGALWLGIRWPK